MDERIDELRERLREDPASRQFYQLGELLRREGEEAEAVEVLRAGLEQHPFYVAAWVSTGRALLALERLDEADEALAEALKLDPENAVAARLRGEVALARGDWLEAVKALKLARALAPGDRDLDERIDELEARLSGGVQPAAAEPVPLGAALVPPPPREVVALSPDDPFEVAPRGDTGVWRLGEADVFAGPEPPDEAGAESLQEVGGVFAAPSEGAELEPSAEDELEPLTEAAPPAFEPPWSEESPAEGEDGGEEPLATGPSAPAEAAAAIPAVTPEAEGEEVRLSEEEEAADVAVGRAVPAEPAEPEPEGVPAATLLEAAPEGLDLPLPTVTLARLAVEQGDLELARRIATAVLQRDPGSLEARELLDGLEETGAAPPAAGPDPRYAKIIALQRWMDAVRLAAGKLAS